MTRLTSIEFDLIMSSQPIPRYWTLGNRFHPISGNPSDSGVTQFPEWDEIMPNCHNSLQIQSPKAAET